MLRRDSNHHLWCPSLTSFAPYIPARVVRCRRVVPAFPLFWVQKSENVERFHILFAIQLIRCPFLNPRIRGVTILSDIIDVTIRNAAVR